MTMTTDVNAVALLMLRSLKRIRRTPLLVAFGVLQPVIWMAMFSQSFRRLADFDDFRNLGYASYLLFFVPSIMMLVMLDVSMQSGMSMLTDVQMGVMDKLLTSPVRRAAILFGRLCADVVVMVAEGLIVIAIAFAMGADINTGLPGALITLVFGAFLGVCFSALSIFIALYTRSSETTMVIGMLTSLPLLFLSSAFFPLELQPHWVRVVAAINPVAHVVKSGQLLFNFGYDWSQLAGTVGVLAIAGAVTFTAAIYAFRRSVS